MIISLILALTATSFTGCATWDHFVTGLKGKEKLAKEADETVRIGVFEPLTGTDKKAASPEVKGIQLAHELFPEVLGKPVELVYGDNKSDVMQAEMAAMDLVNSKVGVVLGSYTSTLSLIGSDIFAKEKIPSIGITCTNPILTKSNPYYARVCFIDAFQGNAAAKYVYEGLGQEKAIALKEEENDYASAMEAQFSEKMMSLTKSNSDVVHTIDYKRGTMDFTDQLKAIKEITDAKTVFLPSEGEVAIEVMKQAKKMGLDLTFVGTDTWETDNFLKKGGKAIEGACFTTLYDAEATMTEMSEVFLNAYQEKYGDKKSPENAVALGFDAYLMALEAIVKAGGAEDRAEIMKQLIALQKFEGATGKITLNSDGDPIKPVAVVKIEKGKMVHTYTAEPAGRG